MTENFLKVKIKAENISIRIVFIQAMKFYYKDFGRI